MLLEENSQKRFIHFRHQWKIGFYGISDRSNQRKGLFFTLFQLFKIGKFHPVFLLMKSQGLIGLNLLVLLMKNQKN